MRQRTSRGPLGRSTKLGPAGTGTGIWLEGPTSRGGRMFLTWDELRQLGLHVVNAPPAQFEPSPVPGTLL